MRVPSEAATPAPARAVRRYQVVILGVIIAIIVALVVVQQTANVFTNYLWFRSVSGDDVWRSMTETKVELGVFFTLIFFVACWLSLLAVDRVAPRALFMSPEMEFVRRYQSAVGTHRLAVRTVFSLLISLAVGAGTTAQWQNWLLFRHGGSFGVLDPQFHRDVGFFVFKLPFLSFLVNWTQLALIVLFIVCVAAYSLNGGLRFSGPPPRVDPRATSHLSVILAAMALLRAAAYFYVDRFEFELTPSGVIPGAQGAGYTAVHVRLPALELLVIVALASFVLFVYNVYARGWMLPAVAAGLWAFIAIVVGVIFPAVVQWLQVTPAQSTVELPYIARDIAATQLAYGLSGVTGRAFEGNHDVPASFLKQDAKSLSDVDLWDPSVSSPAIQNPQRIHGFYSINGLSVDRYPITENKTTSPTPVVIGVREVVSGSLTRRTWVNTHLVYTHGYGAVMITANDATPGAPTFVMQKIPVVSTGGPALTNPAVYYGVGQSGYVVVDSAQQEYTPTASNGEVAGPTRYEGTGGIRIGGFWQKAAFALRFHDFNLLASKLVTSSSRIMFNQDVRSLVQNLAPFLRVDTNPYPVIVGGHIDWMVDAYTTTSFYPYSETVDTSALQPGSGLAGDYNYIRNSVKAVVDAYTGQVTLYDMNPSDPILQAWSRVFPGMFHPEAQMGAALLSHLRYPQDLLSVVATMYGKYHVGSQNPGEFYANAAAWAVAQTATGPVAPFVRPVYQLLALPSQNYAPTFNAFVPLAPLSRGVAQNLTAFMVASCSAADYGKVTAFQIPSTSVVDGPALANAAMAELPALSQESTLLDQHGSRLLYGPTLLIPINDSLLYLRALFVSSSSNSVPELALVAAVYNNQAFVEKTLTGTGGLLSQVFGQSASSIGGSQQTTIPEKIRQDIEAANLLEIQAATALKQGTAGLEVAGKDFAAIQGLLANADGLLAKVGKAPASP